jgi:hypothetical protein
MLFVYLAMMPVNQNIQHRVLGLLTIDELETTWKDAVAT